MIRKLFKIDLPNLYKHPIAEMIKNMLPLAPKTKTTTQRKPKSVPKPPTGVRVHQAATTGAPKKAKEVQETMAISRQVQEIWDLIKTKLNEGDMNQMKTSVNITELLKKLKQMKDKKSTKEMSVSEIKELRKLVCALRENVKQKAETSQPANEVKKVKKKKPEIKEILKAKKSKPKQANKKEIKQVKKSFNETIEKLSGVKFYSIETDNNEKLLKAKLRKMKNEEKLMMKKTKKV